MQVLVVALAVGCGENAAPPGRSVESAPEGSALPVPATIPAKLEASQSAEPAGEPGHGDKIASIAMRTWIYQTPDEHGTKLGYLRAGAVVDRANRSAGNEGCEEGWYRVAPRGYVCVGKGASLDLEHPVVQSALAGPARGEPMPYDYVISRSPPPHRYFKLPSDEEQKSAEGDKRARSMALYAGGAEKLGAPDPLPRFLVDGEPLPKPYGAERPLAYAVHRGRANEASAFGLIATFDWTGRRFGLTTELDLIPLDRTKIAPLSPLRGVVVEGEGTPALVYGHGVKSYERDAVGKLRPTADAPHRSGWVLTEAREGGLAETTAGVWLPAASLRIAKLRDDPADFAERGRKWIDISIKQQLLVAYEGERPVFATLISSGRGGMSDPKETSATIRGAYMIHAKHVSGTMDGDSTTEDSFDLRDVPYIQYFHQGYALHGAYWHDDFGKERSHGCINLAPADAAWLFDWTEPEVPSGWHGTLNLNAGTLVYIHG